MGEENLHGTCWWNWIAGRCVNHRRVVEHSLHRRGYHNQISHNRGLALVLTVGSVPVLLQEGEGESRDALAQIARIAQESAAEHMSGRAEPLPETPDMLPALWEQIKANADPGPDESGA